MVNIYLFDYNNYYNRKIKILGNNIVNYLPSLDPDAENPAKFLAAFEDINFVPNDYINAEQIVNYDGEDQPDYFIVADRDTGNILSRWFVLSVNRTLRGQYILHLYRDVIADYYYDIINAPVFVEKAMVASTDPAIYNSEAMTFNQIKRSETLIKDNTESPWIVGYISKNEIPQANRTINIPSEDIPVSGTYESMDDFPYKNKIIAFPDDVVFITTVTTTTPEEGKQYYSIGWNNNNQLQTPASNPDGENTGITGLIKINPSTGVPPAVVSYVNVDGDFMSNVQSVLTRDNPVWVYGDYTGTANLSTTNSYINAAGNIYKIGNEYYHFNYGRTTPELKSKIVPNASGLSNDVLKILQQAGMSTSEAYGNGYVDIEYYETEIVPIIEAININSISFTLKETIQNCVDAPYNIFAIPFGEVECDLKNSKISNPEGGYNIAQALQQVLDKNIYDLQLLPYCPLPNSILSANGSVNRSVIPSNSLNLLLQDITDSENNFITTIFFIRNSTFSKSIRRYTIPIPSDSVEMKVSNECEVYRLCSPNYNGQFEFSAVKNNGVSYWKVDCTYRPFTPYIHIAPDFKGLYGTNFDDARGLICGGDFSLSQISDKWQEYQIQNKNYQSIFDRQIENMEIQNKYARMQDIANAAVGTVQGATTGAVPGAMTRGGNPYAAAGGAIVGGTASLAGGITDLFVNNKLRQEAIDYTRDQFGYQLGNIRALPYSLTKVSAFNANNKVFPFVEFYDATEEEKQALRDKIKYNGMSVGRIGKISDFKQVKESYIKCKLIRLEINDDFLIVNTIANELNKGVFI